jgi:hypothetical protein
VAVQQAQIRYPDNDRNRWIGVVFQKNTTNNNLIWPVNLSAGEYHTCLRPVGDLSLHPGDTYTFEVSDATPTSERSDSHTVNASSKPHLVSFTYLISNLRSIGGAVKNTTCTKLHDAKVSEMSISYVHDRSWRSAFLIGSPL